MGIIIPGGNICSWIADHFCKLKENSPQIHADFVTQMNADKAEGPAQINL